MGNLGTTELILIFLGVLLFFGARKIPELARGLGKGIREFKRATYEIEETLTEVKKTGDEAAVELRGISDSVRGAQEQIRRSIGHNEVTS